jgi:hypothetical protein
MGALFDWLQNVTGATLPSNIVTGRDAVLEDNAQAGMSGADALARSKQTVPPITGGDLGAGQPWSVPAISGDIHGADQPEIASPAAEDNRYTNDDDSQYDEQSTPGADDATAQPSPPLQPQAGLTDARPDPSEGQQFLAPQIDDGRGARSFLRHFCGRMRNGGKVGSCIHRRIGR